MQSMGVWSLNHHITTSLGLSHTPMFLKSTHGLHRCNSVRVDPYAYSQHIKVLLSGASFISSPAPRAASLTCFADRHADRMRSSSLHCTIRSIRCRSANAVSGLLGCANSVLGETVHDAILGVVAIVITTLLAGMVQFCCCSLWVLGRSRSRTTQDRVSVLRTLGIGTTLP